MKIAFISDIHEDIISLMQAERIINKKRCDMVICLGDIVGFSIPFYDYLNTRNASACVKWVKKNCTYAVAGNHDLYAIKKVPKSKVREFTYPSDWYSLTYSKRKTLSQDTIWLYEDNELSALLEEDDIAFLSQLPETDIINIDGIKFMISHFIYPDITGSTQQFIYTYADLVEHLQFSQKQGCHLSFSGHMHYEGISKIKNRNFHRVGFGKKTKLSSVEWFSLPPISNSKSMNGLVIWDTDENIIEAHSLRKTFKLI